MYTGCEQNLEAIDVVRTRSKENAAGKRARGFSTYIYPRNCNPAATPAPPYPRAAWVHISGYPGADFEADWISELFFLLKSSSTFSTFTAFGFYQNLKSPCPRFDVMGSCCVTYRRSIALQHWSVLFLLHLCTVKVPSRDKISQFMTMVQKIRLHVAESERYAFVLPTFVKFEVWMKELVSQESSKEKINTSY